MIIRVKRENKKQKVIKGLLSAIFIVAIFGYLYYNIMTKTHEDNANYLKKVETLTKDKKESRAIQRAILDEADNLIVLLGAKNIERIQFYKKYLILFVTTEESVGIMKARYQNLVTSVEVDGLWKVKLNLKEFLTVRQKDGLFTL